MSSIDEPLRPVTPRTQATPALSSPSSTPATTGISSHRSLARAVFERRHEYTRAQTTRVKIGSWNVAALTGCEKDLKGWFVQGKGVSESLSGLNLNGNHQPDPKGGNEEQIEPESVVDQERRRSKKESTIPHNDPGSLPNGEDIGLYVLGLQEILDISSTTEALRPYNDPHPANKWKAACDEAIPEGYRLVAEQQLSGMLLLIYASPVIAPTVSSVSVTSVGTGLMGYMGNKGATVARIVLGETTRLVFVNSHLAAGTGDGALERRNWDSSQIVARTKFDPIDYGNGVIDEIGETIGDEDFAFWFGDLNYRLADLPGDDVRRLLMIHTRNEYDIRQASLIKIDKELKITEPPRGSETGSSPGSSGDPIDSASDEDEVDPENDPASLQTTLSSLLPHDQLHDQMRKRKAFHDGWQEGPIKFLPTYKYDVGSVGMFDSSDKKRGPSWCDRILYRTRRDYQAYMDKVAEEAQVRKKDAEMKARGLDQSGDDVLFDYDPETDAHDEYDDRQDEPEDPEVVITKAGYEDRIRLEYYTSHQRVLSSDHKPLDAIFELNYEAVGHALKAEIQAEVARELDKDENESRPTITLVVNHAEVKDGSHGGINFGDITYDTPKTHSITVANTGRVNATFGFVQDISGQNHDWLQVTFNGDDLLSHVGPSIQHTVEPGDTMNIVLTIHVVSMADVRALNTKTAPLEDVRVLRVHGGRDYFITLKGDWLNSSFGLSLEKLIRVPEAGVRSCALDSSLDAQEVKWSAPRELFRLTEALEELLERAVAEWGMKDPTALPPWDSPGWPFLSSTWSSLAPARDTASRAIRESLDTNAPFSYPEDLTTAHKVEALAVTLLCFIASLDGGIVDTALWTALSKALADLDKAKKSSDPESTRALILEVVSSSPARSVAFTFITFMLARVAGEVAPLSGAATINPPAPKLVDGIIGRHRAVSEDARVVKRREVEKRFAEVFEGVVFSVEGEGKKEKRSGEEKRRAIIEVFLHGRWGDG